MYPVLDNNISGGEMIYIQTSSRDNENMYKTLENAIPLINVRRFVDDATYARLAVHHPDGKIHFWANKPGKHNCNITRAAIHQIPEGTRIYFQHTPGQLYYRGVVSMAVFNNVALADHLWGKYKDGSSFQYIYTIRDLTKLSRFGIFMKDACLAFGSTREYFNGVTRLEEVKERRFVNYVQAREELGIEMTQFWENYDFDREN
jgi:hypothetical protein